jgi:hypothetical protein
MSFCVYSVFALSCMQVAALRRAITRPRSPTVCVKMIMKLRTRPGPDKRAVEPLMRNE